MSFKLTVYSLLLASAVFTLALPRGLDSSGTTSWADVNIQDTGTSTVSQIAKVSNFTQSNSRSIGRRAVAPVLSLTNSQWIWTGENAGPGGNAPIGTRAFRKTFASSSSRFAICSTVLITADNNYTLYVNGIDIGSTSNLQTSFQAAQAFNAPLQPSSNLFAILATNSGGPAAVIATIVIEYSDGSNDTIVTDASWKTFIGSVPANFQNPSLNDSSWSAASEQGTEGVGPWGITAIPPVLDLTQSNWIWTGETVNGVAPLGSRAFRKTVITGGVGRYAVCATVLITCDNEYTLYINGDGIGFADNWESSQAFVITFLSAEVNVFSILGSNVGTAPNPAGVIASILITYSDGRSETFITDTTWRAFIGDPPINFSNPAIDDSSWSSAVVVGRYGDGPWGDVAIPAA